MTMFAHLDRAPSSVLAELLVSDLDHFARKFFTDWIDTFENALAIFNKRLQSFVYSITHDRHLSACIDFKMRNRELVQFFLTKQ